MSEILTDEAQAYKYELDPTEEQIKTFKRCAYMSVVVYNMAVRHCYEVADATSGQEDFQWGVSYMKLQALWREARKKHPHLQELSGPPGKGVPAGVYQYAAIDAERAFRNTKHGSRKPKEKFDGGHSFSVGPGKYGKDYFVLPVIGKVKTKERIRLRYTKLYRVTVSVDAVGRWYISQAVYRDREVKEAGGPSVGIDLGLTKYLALSNGEVIEPLDLSSDLKRLDRWNRRLSRKQRGSNNYRKFRLKINRLHRRMRNKRKDFLHKLTARLAKTYGEIVIEDLNVLGLLQKRERSRSIAGASWGMFRILLERKCAWYGCDLYFVPRYFPSTCLCCECGKFHRMQLADRVYCCSDNNCSNFNGIDRDLNAAKNLVQQLPELRTDEEIEWEKSPEQIAFLAEVEKRLDEENPDRIRKKSKKKKEKDDDKKEVKEELVEVC